MKQVKTLATLFLLTALTVFSGCEKDEEKTIEKWIVGTWELDRYVQQDFKDGVMVSESESLDQGKVKFNDDGTGDDIGGNFIGGDFEWSNTVDELTLITGGGITIYDIEEYSKSNFVFSLTDWNGNDKSVERWYLSK
jgi:hypothetical protein